MVSGGDTLGRVVKGWWFVFTGVGVSWLCVCSTVLHCCSHLRPSQQDKQAVAGPSDPALRKFQDHNYEEQVVYPLQGSDRPVPKGIKCALLRRARLQSQAGPWLQYQA